VSVQPKALRERADDAVSLLRAAVADYGLHKAGPMLDDARECGLRPRPQVRA
jgi:hypothetical protein